MCPKSYLYIYDFSAYLYLSPSNRSVPIGAGSAMSRFSAFSIRRDMFPNIAPPLFATRGGYNGGNDLAHVTHTQSLSLSLSRCLCTRAIQLLYKSATTSTYTLPKS